MLITENTRDTFYFCSECQHTNPHILINIETITPSHAAVCVRCGVKGAKASIKDVLRTSKIMAAFLGSLGVLLLIGGAVALLAHRPFIGATSLILGGTICYIVYQGHTETVRIHLLIARNLLLVRRAERELLRGGIP